MKSILLINPPSTAIDLTNKVTPLGLCCIAGVLLESGHKVQICDMNVGDRLTDYDFRFIDYVGITATTPVMNSVYDIAKHIKIYTNFHPVYGKIIIGGAHATALPDDYIGMFIDIACIGEGDYFIDNLISGQNRKVTDLDLLPYPAYRLLNPKKYTSDIARKNPYATIETSRGCYAQCTYCYKAIFGNKMRFKSPCRVIGEMAYLKISGYNEVHIMDDNFTADIRRAKEICRLLIESNLKMSWVTRCGIRVDRVDEELLDLMWKAGCYKVFFGVESGSQGILNGIKKNITLGEVEYAVKLAKKIGLQTGAYYMMGLPGETVEDLDKTIDFACKLDTDSVSCGIAVPLPGTEFFDQAVKAGRIRTFDWSQYTFNGNVYYHENLSSETIRQYVKKFNRRYYFRLRYILRKLFSRDMLKSLVMFWKIIKRFK